MLCERMQSFSWKSNNLEKNANVLRECKVSCGNTILLQKNTNVLSEKAKFLMEKQ